MGRHGRRRPGTLWTVVALIVDVAGLAACSGGSQGPAPTIRDTPTPTEQAHFVIDQDFPDPDVLHVGDQYYAYATNTAAVNVQLATSRDLQTWKVADTDMLPRLPSWALPGRTWAPDVSEVSPGRYVMYVVAASAAPALQCIGVAVAGSPDGPFTPVGDAPLICPPDEGGAIDPSSFVDSDGTRYLVWKNDGNCCHLDTWLQLTPLTTDGLSIAGPSVRLLKQTEAWEGTVTEAPTLVKRGGSYVLLYSANSYADSSYAIGFATAPAIVGPYTKNPAPLLSTVSSAGRFVGPGGQDVVTAPDGTDRLIFHSWDPAGVYRGMNALPLEWTDDRPFVVQ